MSKDYSWQTPRAQQNRVIRWGSAGSRWARGRPLLCNFLWRPIGKKGFQNRADITIQGSETHTAGKQSTHGIHATFSTRKYLGETQLPTYHQHWMSCSISQTKCPTRSHPKAVTWECYWDNTSYQIGLTDSKIDLQQHSAVRDVLPADPSSSRGSRGSSFWSYIGIDKQQGQCLNPACKVRESVSGGWSKNISYNYNKHSTYTKIVQYDTV